jgi:hypothetical protein
MTTFASTLRRVAHGIAVLAFVGAAGLAFAQPEPTLNDVYATAQAGKLDDAQVMMQQVLIAHPNSAKAHFVRSELFAKQGKFGPAREALATAEKLAPGLPFAQPESVQALRAELSGRSSAPSNSQPAAAPATSSWATPVLLTGAVIALGYFMFRRRVPQPLQPPSSGRFGYAASQAQQGVPQPAGGLGNWPPSQGYAQPTGSGLGGRIAGGLATGLAVGAGVMAAEAIGRNLTGGHGRDNNLTMDSFANEQDADALRRNADMGGQDFGVNDVGSWDDAGIDVGSNNDWDT